MGGAGGEDGRYGEGRYIDPRVGVLAGEASEQRVPERRQKVEGAVPYDVWREVPPPEGRRAEEDVTYYDRPVLKEPTWIWAVPAYFYAGGTAGAAAVLELVAALADAEDLDGLITRCRWISAVGDAAGTALLIEDLGRPERFANMLRVFRPSSPMSVGSWVLAISVPAAGASVLFGKRHGPLGFLGNAGTVVSGLTGLPLTGYTAVLLSNTAVPLWQATRRSLPLLFMSSAVTSAASLLDLTDLTDREQRIVRRYGLAGKLADLAAAMAVEREADEVEEVGTALHEGAAGTLWRAAKVLIAASAALSLVPGTSNARRRLSGALGTLGAISMRFAVFHAGKRSSVDPRATFRQQRAGRGGAEATGTAAVTGPDGRRAVS
jgi:formate-dependent nitrite reductase membrane component NrfD